MLPQEIIRAKRDGKALPPDDIAGFVAGIADGTITEGQVAAFAMAVFLRGMTRAETVAVTLAMRDSGDVLDWAALGLGDAPLVDKHSTGGVGDKVSLILAPLAAACGALVPMISGRGLGHGGGTLDKMDSIPGYRSQVDAATLARVTREAGCAIVGATGDIAPADRRLYAIRDVTGTVESIPLITGSILSKKLAAAPRALVMDVKCGNGAFMTTEDDARALAESLVAVASGAGVATTALITDMDQVLGTTAGNALEVTEAIDFLTGTRRESRLAEVTLALVAEMLLIAGLTADLTAGRRAAEAHLADGSAAEHFARMVAALGGPADLLQRPAAHLAAAPVVEPVPAPRPGTLARMDTREIGLAILELGGGRTRADQAIDPAVGVSDMLPLGTQLTADTPLCLVHARTAAEAAQARQRILAAVTIADEVPTPPPIIRGRIAEAV